MQDELISREAVLDGLKGCICDEWVKTLFATMVKLLPSVTPTQKNTLENTLENTLDDAINRRASIDALKKHFSDDDGIDTECGAYWHHADVIEVLQGLPPVTPKPDNKYRKQAKRWKNKWLRLKSQKSKTGHWKAIERKPLETPRFECSECHTQEFVETCMYKPIWNYCPNCGAKMESEVQTDAT